jgi:hypothetical protein
VLGWGLLALAAALATNSILGPFLADLIDYPVSESMRNQTVGLDAASLLVVAPIIVVVGILVLRNHRGAPVLALGPAGYVAYMFVQYVAGPDRLTYPPVLMLQLGLFAGGWLLAGLAWRLDGERSADTRPGGSDLAPWHGWVALALGAFVLVRYVPGLIGSVTDEPLPGELAADPAMYWLIVLLDLGVYLPATALAATGLRRGERWATRLHRGLVGWFVLTTIAVVAMAAAMQANDDPNASVGQLALLAPVAAAATGYTVAILRPVLRRSIASPSARPGPQSSPASLDPQPLGE